MSFNAPPPPPPPPAPYGYGRPPLPSQVSTVSILLFIAGGFGVLGGLLSFAVSGLGGFFVFLGVVLLVIGIAEIYVGVNLRRLKEWARVAAMALAGIGAVLSLINLVKGGYSSVIGLILDGVIIYLLTQKPVVAAFARTGP